MGYQEDIVKAIRRETELIKKQTMLEVISVVTTCNTYDEFKRAMYGMALQYFREMEDEGLVEKGTVDKVIKSSATDSVVSTDVPPVTEMEDDMFMI
jgi:hypothetical protein